METLLYSLLAFAIFLYEVYAFIHVLLHARQPQSALAWSAAIFMVPFFGASAYFLAGIKRVDSRASQLLRNAAASRRVKVMDENKELLIKEFLEKEEEKNILEKYAEENKALYTLFKTSSVHATSLYSEVTPLYNGDMAYPRMLKAIDDAKNEVYLASYIFSGERAAKDFSEALIRAKKRGVEVRVLVDGLSHFLTRDIAVDRMKKEGLKVAKFLPPSLCPPQFSLNLRNHRKLLICDNTAFTGGMNISDGNILEALSGDERNKKGIQDLHFFCEGTVAVLFREAFLMDWTFVAGEDTAPPLSAFEAKGEMCTRVLVDGLGSKKEPIVKEFCAAFSAAKHSITLLSPYFLPPTEIKSALFSAAARGVKVKVIVPEVSDHFYFQWACDHGLAEFAENNIEIYYQPQPFAHTKLLLIDNIYTCFGSTNMDSRSLSLNFEINVEVLSEQLNAELKEYAIEILNRSRQYIPHVKISLLARLRNACVWIFTPYL